MFDFEELDRVVEEAASVSRRETDGAGNALSLEQLRAACRLAGIEPLSSATASDLLGALDTDLLRDACAEKGLQGLRLDASKEELVGALAEADAVGSEVMGMSSPRGQHERGIDDGGGCFDFEPYKTDPYKVLGVSPDATDARVKSAFRKASVLVHPDRCPDDQVAARRFRLLTRAKDFLLDPFHRRMYNHQNNLITPTSEGVMWWSNWHDIFGEIEPEAEDGGRGEASVALPACLTGGRVDMLIFGATGLTGTMACMLMQRGLSPRHTWAIAGRDEGRLNLVGQKFGTGSMYRGATLLRTTADLDRAVRSARVVLDASGPSHEIGTGVAEACIRAGTHLIDCTGDVLFSKEVKETLHTRARAAGVCMVFHAGYASLPVDFGAYHVIQHLRAKHGLPTRRVDSYSYTQGFVMSGTSLLTTAQAGIVKKLREAGAPFILGGMRSEALRDEDRDLPIQTRDAYSGMWAVPGLIPDRMVPRATCALLEDSQPYGPNFLFKDWFLFPDKAPEKMNQVESKDAARLGTIGAGMGMMNEKLVEQGRIPPRGWGPRERIRQETFVMKVFVATADDHAERPRQAYSVLRAGPGGVGDRYEGTAAMMLAAAGCVLQATDAGGAELLLRPGWGTPVYHLAHLNFLERLQELDFHFEVHDGAPSQEFFERLFAAQMPLKDST